MKKVTSFFFVFGLIVLANPTYVSHAASFSCTNLSRYLGSGSNDSTTGGEVTKLQNFLKAGGYLTATPNGNFGPATIAAVKSFQSASGISATGTVGPLTRVAVQIKSCATPNTTSQPVSEPSTTTSNTSSTKAVTAPVTGERLTLGKQFTIVWKDAGDNQDIILEDSSGLAQGFITSSTGGNNSYSWKVGRVYSSKTNSDTDVTPGTYRIRVRGRGVDQVSGFFNIDVPSLSVRTLIPSDIVADGSSSGVIYGSGFTESLSLFIDNRFRTSARRLYLSPDGKIVVFAIPTSISAGSHSIILDNGYGGSVTAGIITVISPQASN